MPYEILTGQPVCPSVGQHGGGGVTDEWTDIRMDGQMYGQMYRQTYGLPCEDFIGHWPFRANTQRSAQAVHDVTGVRNCGKNRYKFSEI